MIWELSRFPTNDNTKRLHVYNIPSANGNTILQILFNLKNGNYNSFIRKIYIFCAQF